MYVRSHELKLWGVCVDVAPVDVKISMAKGKYHSSDTLLQKSTSFTPNTTNAQLLYNFPLPHLHRFAISFYFACKKSISLRKHKNRNKFALPLKKASKRTERKISMQEE